MRVADHQLRYKRRMKISIQNVHANLGPLQPACEDHYPAAARLGLEEVRHGGQSPGSRAP